MVRVDARGKACPTPVIMTKEQMDNGADEIIVLVDNATAAFNVSKLANSSGFSVSSKEVGDDYQLTLSRGEKTELVGGTLSPLHQHHHHDGECSCGCGHDHDHDDGFWAVFAGRDAIGDGDRDLGESLMKMFFFTIASGEDIPRWVFLMNSGVKLACGDNPAIEHLQKLVTLGTEILVCGTCLSHYDLTDELKVGTVSNMYDISLRMHAANKVISL